MNISLILIGSELLNGKIQDKNAYLASQILFAQNLALKNTQIIPDEEVQFNQALQSALSLSDVVILSGGLGPTGDDLTMDFLAKFFNKEIIESEEATQIARAHYARAGREFNHSHSKYRLLPKDFNALTNPQGLAPGLSYLNQNKLICALPGVPREFETMLTQVVIPLIKKNFKLDQVISKNVVVKTRGVPEEALFKKLAPSLWSNLEKFGSVSSLPHFLGVDIGVFIQAKDQSGIEVIERKILETINATPIKEHIWHIGPEDLETVVINEARAKKITFGFTESCTGGLNAHRITNISGSSSVFWGSIISYDNSVKEKVLKVKTETLKNFGAVSIECAKEMSLGARELLKVDIAISTTGICGPTGGTVQKPVGMVGIGFCDEFGHEAGIHQFFGDRETLKWRFSQMALYILLERIRAWKKPSP